MREQCKHEQPVHLDYNTLNYLLDECLQNLRGYSIENLDHKTGKLCLRSGDSVILIKIQPQYDSSCILTIAAANRNIRLFNNHEEYTHIRLIASLLTITIENYLREKPELLNEDLTHDLRFLRLCHINATPSYFLKSNILVIILAAISVLIYIAYFILSILGAIY